MRNEVLSIYADYQAEIEGVVIAAYEIGAMPAVIADFGLKRASHAIAEIQTAFEPKNIWEIVLI